MIELLSYNTHLGKNIEQINGWIQDLPQPPEIVCLQEYPANHLVNNQTPLGPNYGIVFGQGWSKRGSNHGELTAYRQDKLQAIDSRIQNLGLSLLEKYVRRLSGERSALLTSFEMNGEPLLVANIHLSWFSAHEFRRRQLAELLGRITGPEASIIVGDFNYTNRIAGAGLGDFMKDKGYQLAGDSLHTHRFFLIGQQLDYFFQRNCAVVDVRTENVPYSDHKPMFVRFEMLK